MELISYPTNIDINYDISDDLYSLKADINLKIHLDPSIVDICYPINIYCVYNELYKYLDISEIISIMDKINNISIELKDPFLDCIEQTVYLFIDFMKGQYNIDIGDVWREILIQLKMEIDDSSRYGFMLD